MQHRRVVDFSQRSCKIYINKRVKPKIVNSPSTCVSVWLFQLSINSQCVMRPKQYGIAVNLQLFQLSLLIAVRFLIIPHKEKIKKKPKPKFGRFFLIFK